MDGGVGEAALIGAVIGGGSAAITGGDPLKGALMGGATSGLMGGFGGVQGVDPFTMGQTGVDAYTASQAVTPEIVNAGGYAANIPVGGSEAAISNFPEGLSYNPGAGYGSVLNAPVAPNVADTTAFTGEGVRNIADTASGSRLHGLDLVKNNKMLYGGIGASQALPGLMAPKGLGAVAGTEKYTGPLSRFRYDPATYQPDVVMPPSPAYRPVYAADGGLMDAGNQGIAGLSANPSYPMADQQQSRYAVPSQMPVSAQDIRMAHMAPAPMAKGGIADLGGYSDGGRMLKGPGDGMSDSIPASISGKQPARLADGEFVVPADVVSHLGNGSTDAGAKQLYKMMDKVRTARTGRKAQGKQINPRKYVPA